MPDPQNYMLDEARALAFACHRARVTDNQLSLVLAHLKRHRNVTSTRLLLDQLPRTSFARQSKQLEALQRLVGQKLMDFPDWQRAASLVGWARRLLRWAKSADPSHN